MFVRVVLDPCLPAYAEAPTFAEAMVDESVGKRRDQKYSCRAVQQGLELRMQVDRCRGEQAHLCTRVNDHLSTRFTSHPPRQYLLNPVLYKNKFQRMPQPYCMEGHRRICDASLKYRVEIGISLMGMRRAAS